MDIKWTPFFIDRIWLQPDAPGWILTTTREIDPPFRISKSNVWRIWGSYGIVFGKWKESGLTEWEALTLAIEAKDMNWEDFNERV